MADNVLLNGTGTAGGATMAGASLSISGDTAVVQMVGDGILSGSEGSWTYSLLVGGAGAVAAGVQRVTLASDDPAVVLLGTIDTDTGAISTAAAAIQAAVEGTLTVGSHAVTNAGTFAVQVDGAALTALQLIDDAVYTDATGTPSKGLAVMGTDGTNPQIISVDSSGNVQVDLVSANVTNAGTFAVQEDGAALTALQNINTVLGSSSLVLATQADNVVNTSDGLQTTSFGYVFDGTTWDRTRGDSTNGVLVNLGSNNDVTLATLPDTGSGDLAAINAAVSGTLTVGSHAVTNAGTFAVQVDGAALTALQLIDNTVYVDDADWTALTSSHNLIGGIYQSSPGAITDGDTGPIRLTANGAVHISDAGGSLTVDATELTTLAGAVSGSEMQVDVVGSLPAGTNAIGKLASNSGVDIGDVDVLSIAAGSNLIGDVSIQGRATGGASCYYDNDLDETAVAVKPSAGTLYAIHAINTTNAILYLQFWDTAQGSVTVGTTTPVMQFIIPGNNDTDGAGFTYSVPQGIRAFSTAITAACTTTSEGNGAPGANACHVNLSYV